MNRKALLIVIALSSFALINCPEDEVEAPPPPPQPQQPAQPTQPVQPQVGQPNPGQPTQPVQPYPGQPTQPVQPYPGQPNPGFPTPGVPTTPGVAVIPVTLTANSTPPGATVLRPTGEVLGTTPLVSQINVPSDQLGMPQTFTFNLAGYQPATSAGVVQNNSVQIQANLMPMPGMGPQTISVSSGGGGPIYDFNTTSARANVDQPCIINTLTVRIRGNHSYHGDLSVRLRGPAGQSATLHNRTSANPFRTYTVNRATGTQAQGTWTLSVHDQVRADSGNLQGFSMEMTCM